MNIYCGILDKESIFEVQKLVDRVYLEEGYIGQSAEKKQGISRFLDLEHTISFGLCIEGRLIGTVSVVSDSEDYGLPLDSVFPEETTPFRSGENKVGEVCQFVIDKRVIKSMIAERELTSIASLGFSRQLLQQVFLHGINKSFSHFVFTINPKHRGFYESLGARQVGKERSYSSVNNAPALLFIIEIEKLRVSPLLASASIKV